MLEAARLMKVLILYPKFYIFGGAEIVIVRLCNYLTRAGIGNAVMTTRSLPEVESELTETKMILMRNRREEAARNNTDIVRGEIEAFDRGIREYGREFDVINPHNFPTELSSMHAKRPAVWMCNEPELYLTMQNPLLNKAVLSERNYMKYLYWYEKFLLKSRIDASVVSDRFNAERFRKIYRARPHVIHYGIEYEFFSEQVRPAAFAPSRYEGRFVVLHVGMVTPLKNQMASLEAIAALKEKIPSILLVLAGSIGDKTYGNTLNQFIYEKGLARHVEFAGHVDRERLRELYHLADVMLHPVNAQGGWLSPFEMLSAGKPIVVSTELTASHIIRENNIGIVTDDFMAGIIEIRNNYPRYLEMAQRGKEFVRDNLRWDDYCRKMLDLFESLAAKHHRKR